LDPIHIRARFWSMAWNEILSAWANGQLLPEPAETSAWQWLRFGLLAPEQRWLLGIAQRRTQPCARFADSTLISLY
jgi:hypothetical protein